jgi:hypothetical protein
MDRMHRKDSHTPDEKVGRGSSRAHHDKGWFCSTTNGAARYRARTGSFREITMMAKPIVFVVDADVDVRECLELLIDHSGWQSYASLSRRERAVMELVVSSLLNKQVGGELGISEITVS